MKFYKWQGFVDCDIFAEVTDDELEYLKKMFPREDINASSLEDKYYFFINTKIKKIAPMSLLSYAFGGMYYELPIGEEIPDFKFNCAEYEMVPDDFLIEHGRMRAKFEDEDADETKHNALNMLKLKVFAEKWSRLFLNSSWNGNVIDSLEFPEEAWEAGLEMDCGKSFAAAYPGINADGEDNNVFENALKDVTDIRVLGNLIFSKWRWWNHWAGTRPGIKDFVWFSIAFNRLLELLNECSERNNLEMPKIIGFHAPDEEYGCFSNWYISKFKYAGQTYSSVEQFMMYHKVMMSGNMDLANKIMFTDNPAEIKELAGPKYFHDFSKIAYAWDRYSMTIVKRGVRAKFMQDRKLMAKLLLTGNAILAECAGSDDKWGIGINIKNPDWHDVRKWQGDNKLGRILMELRSEFLAMQAKGKSLIFRDACKKTCGSREPIYEWQLSPAELARYPEYHNTIYAFVSTLSKAERSALLDGTESFADWEYAMCTNMGGGLRIWGFYEMKQDIYDIAEMMK